MKRGLKVALMTVAVALLGAKAMAMAPVIGEIPSPVVGGAAGGTDATSFVFGDALNLDSYVTDDTITDLSQIKWTYEVTGTQLYSINGQDPINSSTDDPNAPTATQEIRGTVNAKETVNPDGKSNTITIRNINKAPFGGTTATPGASGSIIDTQVVTLHASDGALYDSQEVMFYTDDGGTDRLSTGTTWEPVADDQFDSTNQDGWKFWSVAGGPITSSTAGNTAVCLETGMTNGNFGSIWASPWGTLDLVKNAVYRIRLSVTFTPPTANASATTPFWDLYISNMYTDGATGLQAYAGDFLFLQNVGDTYKVSTTGSTYDIYWCPASLLCDSWNSTTDGAFSAANATNKDAYLAFRVMDTDTLGAITATEDGGKLCLNSIAIDRSDYNEFQVASNVYSPTMDAGHIVIDPLAGSTIAFASGAATVTPSAGAMASEYLTVAPGDGNWAGDAATYTRYYPVVWEAKTLYRIQMSLQAPDANSQTNPWDAMWLSVDEPTIECSMTSLASANGKAGSMAMPKTTASTYVAFFYSNLANTTSAATGANYTRLRPRLNLGNSGDLTFGNNSGALKINSIKVDKMSIPE